MQIAKLHLLPALLLIATVKLEIVASQLNWDHFQSLKGQVSSSSCAPVVTDTSSYTSTPGNETNTITTGEPPLTSTTDPDPSITSTSDDYSDIVPRSVDLNSDLIGDNVEFNTVNNTNTGRNRQTIRIQRRPLRRRSQRRRRRQNRRRPSGQKRRRGNRHSSKNRRRRRRGGQRRGQPNRIRRVYVRRRNSNRRISDQRN